ncbi:MAG: bifunctional aminotransferase class I/II-fold pyridoxal phosphate-dependent enzyme/GNAT family N-acetyltransferase [Gammaproteobacteria bacterium]
MAKQQSIDLVDQIFTLAKDKGIFHLQVQDKQLDGRIIHSNQKTMINFGSCSYLGLERDPRLINACIESVQRYGTQFSSSRSYLSSPHYEELEALLSQLYDKPALVTPTTTLGHIAALPILVKPGDLIVLDHQVHAAVQNACKLLKAQGEKIQMIRHNDLNHLEKLIKQHRQTTHKIWYCIDGVYSMYGDLAPIDELYQLMDTYPEFYLYADDAHGMSWCGKQGKGSVRGFREHHPQLVLSVSLNKAFGCAGGLLVLPNEEMKRRIRNCGSSLVFSGPIQPPLLGAAIASARIHLSGEIETLQENLHNKINYCRTLIQQHHLPDVAYSQAPIFYIGTGELKAGFSLVKMLIDSGFYVNIGLFPAVPLSNSGVRFTITNHITHDDIKALVETLAHQYPIALAEGNITSQAVSQAFKFSGEKSEAFIKHYPPTSHVNLRLQVFQSIEEVKSEWSKRPEFFGMTGVKNFKLLEDVISVQDQNKIDPNHWVFQYVAIRDGSDALLLLTMFTICDIKTDMFARAELSDRASEQRKTNPEAFVSRCIMMGTPITEGAHLFLDEYHAQHKEALHLLLKHASYLQQTFQAEILSLRDFAKDSWIVEHIKQIGFLVQDLPDTHHLNRVKDFGSEDFIADLNKRNRAHWRKSILPFLDLYTLHEVTTLNQEDLDCFYQFYLAVQERSKEISTFPLPRELFQQAVKQRTWRCFGLKHENTWAACMFAIIDGEHLSSIIIGTDPHFKDRGVYRTCLYHLNKLAQSLSLTQVHHGLTASLEKRRLGATATPIVALLRTSDNFQLEALESLSTPNHRKSEKRASG